MRRFALISFIILLGTLSAREYTLNELMQAGMENAYAIKQKSILRKNADLGLRTATWDLLPSADISYNRTNRDGTHTSSASFALSKTLTLNEPTYFNYRNAQLDKEIANLDWQQAKKEIAYRFYLDWLALIQKEREIAIQTENLRVQQQTTAQTRMLFRLGQRTAYDVSQSEITELNSSLAIQDLQNQLTKQRRQFFSDLRLQDMGYPFAEAEAIKPDTTAVFALAEVLPYYLHKLRMEIRKSELNKRQQQLGLFPTLSAQFSYDYSSRKNKVLDFEKYDDGYTLGLMVNWSLWSIWQKGNKYAQTMNTLQLKRWEQEDSRITYVNSIQNIKREWDYLKESYRLNLRKESQAKENLRIAQERYRLGNLTLLELEQAQLLVLEAQLAVNRISNQLLAKVQEWNLVNSHPILDKY